MREIKFRAYYEGKFHYNIDRHKIVHHELSGRDGEVWDFSDWLKYAKVQQYTGLKDKNGNEIYEGDLVKAYLNTEDTGEIIFKYGGFCFNSSRFQGTFLGIVESGFSIEVIGNIFENPELIK